MDTSVLLAGIAGVAGSALLIGSKALNLQIDPRPCWEKTDCGIRRANTTACEACPVYVFRNESVSSFLVTELNMPPLRAFASEPAAA